MKENLTIAELEQRWETALLLTQDAVKKNPGAYRNIKSMANDVIGKPLDIKEYMPTAKKLVDLLQSMDPNGKGSIFNLFSERILPASIWQVPLFRVECKDLLEHLEAFDCWRRESHGITIVK